jgi:hypothetical protein
MCDQFFGTLRYVTRLPHALNVIENIVETCWLEIHHSRRTRQSLRELRHSAVTDCADIAQFLGENYIRLQFPQKRFIDGVDATVLLQGAAHPFIYVPTRQTGIMHGAVRDSRTLISFIRKIAFVRNGNDPIRQSKRSGDLGRSRQQ